MSHKADMLAYDREKRVYKDAYVDNFRRVRHFPALAAVGAGRSDGDSIILVEDTGRSDDAPPSHRSKIESVESRLMPTDPLEEMFASTPPLTSFRAAVMRKHTNARRANPIAMPVSSVPCAPASLDSSSRYGSVEAKATFKLSCAAEARLAIERKASYDSDAYKARTMAGRESMLPHGKVEWAFNNPVAAKENVRGRTYFHTPLEGAIKADRRYTQEFISQHVEAYQAARQQVTRARNQS